VTWTPLLTGADADRAREAIAGVARALREPDPAWQVGASLANGDAGLAVFYAYLGDIDTAAACIERAIDAAARTPMVASLHHGYAGIAWATEHLVGRVIAAEPGEDLNADIDVALRDALDDNYDLLTGAIGIGVYALERGPVARDLRARVVAQLAALAQRTPHGVSWLTPPALLDPDVAAEFPRGVVNLGLAHGVPGAIALLAACGDEPTARELLDGAVRYLLAQRLPTGGFPDLAGVTHPARLAWCYGDLAIASALVLAGDRAGRAEWTRAGLDLARATIPRAPETTGVRDACLCHGAAGLGLMYARLAPHAPELAAAATRWFREALALRRPDSPVGGFEPVVNAADHVPLGDTSVGLLTGAAGVALALHAAIGSEPPAWDRVLLLSLS